MKMVKSLLLGSAAGLVAVTAGQAAELPVKAKPVQYVKVCSLYGAGFYYMPGTDMCIKIGGWVRAELTGGNAFNGSMTWGPFNNNAEQRSTSNIGSRARGYITADAREQTAYGVARGYIAVGLNTNDVGLQVASLVDSANRAYIQWAGWTAGLAVSFYDFYSVPAAEYRGGYIPASDTGDGGWWVWGYTAQFGGGFSATAAIEARRMTQIIDQNGLTTAGGGSILPGAFVSAVAGAGAVLPGAGAYGGQQWPDVVANLRVDQAWGSAQVMGALHNVNPTYYSAVNTAGTAPSVTSGHPGDTVGWAVGAGLKVNFPSIAPGDYFQSQVNYTQGALRYLFNTAGTTNYGYTAGANMAWGTMSDCVYGGTVAVGNNTGCNLTTAWGFNASFEHYWNPQWHESLYGAYYQTSYDSQANAMLCEIAGFGNGLGGTFATAIPGCSQNWSQWGVGTRLQWDITKSFYIGVEALYTQFSSAKSGCLNGSIVGGAACTTAGGTAAAGGNTVAANTATGALGSASAWAFTLRMHKDFLP
jgi:Porin subfamily